MTGTAAAEPTRAPRIERELGRYDRGLRGPTVLLCAGIHGNEPAGVHAVRNLLAALHQRQVPVRGQVVGMAGNLQALRHSARFLSRDLNRGWSRRRIRGLLSGRPGHDSAEDGEQREMLAFFAAEEARSRGPLVFVDMHTSSGGGAPFTCTGDTMPNRRLAMSLPVPLILGLEEAIDQAVLEWFNSRGHAGLAVEGGQHEAAETVRNLESAAWLLLVATGAADAADVADLEAHRQRLARAAQGMPAVVEITYRHAITTADRYRMRPGFESFAHVARGQQLGDDVRGPVAAPAAGRVLLPLYQELGEDGFFLGRDVRPTWLHLARGMRRLGLPRILAWLPGIRRVRDDGQTLVVDERIARFLATQILHLLGYRRLRRRGRLLLFSRRYANAGAESLPWRGDAGK